MQRRFRYLALTAIATAIFIVAVLPFLRSWDFGIVNLDDYWYVATHDEIIGGLSVKGLKFAFTDLGESIWMPLTWISYMFDHTIFGMGNWGAFHLHSIVLHGINAVLVFALLMTITHGLSQKDTLRVTACAVSALIWAVHPLRCESAVFIASRKDVLSFLFELLALICWFKKGYRIDRRFVLLYAASLMFFIFGAMAKPSVMTFPALCLIVDIFIFRRVRLVAYIIPLGIAAVLGWFAGFAQAAGGATENIFGTPFWWKLVNAATSVGLYLWNTVIPTNLAPQCVIMWPDWPRFCVPGIVICALLGGWLFWRGMKYWDNRDTLTKVRFYTCDVEWNFDISAAPIFAGFTWFVIAIGPMLGIASFGYHSMADRFTYIPAVGLSLVIVAIVLKLEGKVKEIGGIVALFCFAAALGCFTWRQTGYWENDHKLFSQTLKVDGDANAPAHGILANWYFEFPHDLEKCVEHFEKAIARQPRFIEACFQIYVFALCELGREKEIPALLKKFDGWVFNDIEQNPRWGRDSFRAKFMRNVYNFSRIAYLITQPDLRSVAEEEIRKATCPKDDPTYLYLKWKLALAKGDGKGAKEVVREIIHKANRKGYTQFRYLNGGKDW